ncbi:Ger(x)C family spore germination protein [Paenibacillus harenae]|uniref:Ger(x)C family spore germination protein n=1 Tax=Paenibacillus harenae TaxID=306543 RepID=UPI00278E9D2E|nr:Ger(x)C family spore germination protein [Paenibacillus harenae]MDQ0063841.1 spore germination protein KC [Paenibacillus harenae]
MTSTMLNACMRFIALFTAALLMTLTLSGCWNRRELNDMAVAIAIGIDRVDEQYEVTIQTVDPSQMSNNRNVDRFPTRIYSEKASTIFEALRKVTSKSSRKIYLAHLLLLLFNEEMARDGIKEPLDFLFRDHEVRPDFNIAVTRGYQTKDVLSIVTPLEVLSALDLYRSLNVSQKLWAPTAAVNINEMMVMLTNDGVEPILTGLTLIGDLNKGLSADNVKQPRPYLYFKFKGIGVFRKDRLVGWLNEPDSKSFSYVNNHVSSTVGSVQCPGSKKRFAIELVKSKVSREPSIRNGSPHMKLIVHVSGNVGEVQCETEINDKSIIELQELASEQLKSIIENSIQHVQSQYGVDIYGFGANFHQKYPKQWRQWRTNWNEQFAQMSIEVQMDYHLRLIGKIISPFGNNPQQKKE